MNRLRVCLVAWGDKYCRLAVNVCLPHLHDPDVDVVYDIYADRELPGYKTKRIAGAEQKHQLVTKCHAESLAKGDPTVIMCPDMIVAKGTLKAVLKHVDAGKRMVAVPSPRLALGTALPAFMDQMSNRELVGIGLRNLHPGTDVMFWNSEAFTGTPSQIFWKTSGGMVARCFHMHPLLLWAEGKFAGTVDDGAVNLLNPDEAHVVTDSDEIACFELSPVSHVWQSPSNGRDISKWVKKNTNKMHRWFFTHECHIHTGVKQSIELPDELKDYGRAN